MNNRIKYFCYYNYIEGKNPREGVLSASTKIDYIIDVLNRLGYDVDIISKSALSGERFAVDCGRTIKRGRNTIQHFFSFGYRNRPLRAISRWFNSVHFFFWVLLHVKRKEKVIVYHSLGYCKLLNVLRIIKGFQVIGEIEEIYQDVHTQNKSVAAAEYDFINGCYAYLFPTNLMNVKLNPSSKPSAIVHGVYKQETIVTNKFSDGKIHVVYGGTFDPQKGGALAAAEVGRYLPENYVIHICGFGGNKDVENIKALIKSVNDNSEAETRFEGLLQGAEYSRFIQQCHIGLSTQNPEAAFNDTSFPSKILMYLANGLDVVSVRIPVVETCSVVDSIHFYEKQTPQQIAKAILSVSSATSNKEKLLSRIDGEFCTALAKIVE